MECLNGGIWSTTKEVCFCDYQFTGKDCSRWRHHRCYFDEGFTYRGFLSRTRSGKTCALWTTDNNGLFPIGENGIGVHNLCRNPGKDPKGLWCYVENYNDYDDGEFYEYCNATKCPDSLKINITNFAIDQTSDNDVAVKFLYGPLIIGLCVGMVSLILVIVLADCIRRRRACFKKKKRKTKKDDSSSAKQNASKSSLDVDSIAIKRENENEVPVRLGGVVTVNIDTGEHKHNSLGDVRLEGRENPAFQNSKSMYDAQSMNSRFNNKSGGSLGSADKMTTRSLNYEINSKKRNRAKSKLHETTI